MSEIRTYTCDICKCITANFVTLYVRTCETPWFGQRKDCCENCARKASVLELCGKHFDSALKSEDRNRT